jgi:hypothetical protein
MQPHSRENATGGDTKTSLPAIAADHRPQEWERLVAEASLRWSQLALEFDADFEDAYRVVLAEVGSGPWDTEVAIDSLESAAKQLSSKLRGRADSELGTLLPHIPTCSVGPSGLDGAGRELLQGAGSRKTSWPRSAEASARRARNLWAQFQQDLMDELHDHWRLRLTAARRQWRGLAARSADETSPRRRLDSTLSRAIAAVKDRLGDYTH